MKYSKYDRLITEKHELKSWTCHVNWVVDNDASHSSQIITCIKSEIRPADKNEVENFVSCLGNSL